jgi:hypothetical protein
MSENASEAASAVSCIPMFVAGRLNVTEKRCEQDDFVKLASLLEKSTSRTIAAMRVIAHPQRGTVNLLKKR